MLSPSASWSFSQALLWCDRRVLYRRLWHDCHVAGGGEHRWVIDDTPDRVAAAVRQLWLLQQVFPSCSLLSSW